MYVHIVWRRGEGKIALLFTAQSSVATTAGRPEYGLEVQCCGSLAAGRQSLRLQYPVGFSALKRFPDDFARMAMPRKAVVNRPRFVIGT
jgi:hypothetical protein